MKPFVLIASIALLAADPPAKTYLLDLQKAEIGKVPDEIMVLDGPFSVREVDGHKCLELAGDPIGSFAALFGPTDSAAMDVQGRVWAAARGKRFPVFGIGANDAGGFKLLLNPARRRLELRKGDDTVATALAEWHSATWTWFRLRVQPMDKDKWLITAKVWPDVQKEPPDWSVTFEDADAPSPGRASIWGEDYSEQPIRFDHLQVSPISAATSQPRPT